MFLLVIYLNTRLAIGYRTECESLYIVYHLFPPIAFEKKKKQNNKKKPLSILDIFASIT